MMSQAQKNLIRLFIQRLILHSKPYYPGYKSQFVATFTNDEKQEMENIIEVLKNEKEN